ncbi:MAG: dephospho-CoA kinase [Clostridium sp.]|jgi:dephospho-CoA kinase|nr:dephospho-CoA kinase [Clostridium sp.]
MRLIGIIGPTGAGKSSLCAALAANGCVVLDGDRLARRATLPGAAVLNKLAGEFGADILDKNGVLDRKLLAARAFANPFSTARLNEIIQPAIARLTRAYLTRFSAPLIFLEGAALQDSPLAEDCAAFVAVSAPEELRLARVMVRDKLTREEAEMRMNAQRSDEDYRALADYVVLNDGSANLEEQAKKLLEELECIS